MDIFPNVSIKGQHNPGPGRGEPVAIPRPDPLQMAASGCGIVAQGPIHPLLQPVYRGGVR